ncbi:MAG TPA: flagellar hook-basal body complex protein FliE [Sedimentisphaerales bacterium]|nr:flagellar hook-basal body complex protein FliE [Sedimentisphaerales bacterium]
MIDPTTTVSGLMNSANGPWGPGSVRPGNGPDAIGTSKTANSDDKKTGFADAIKDYISKVDDLQQSSDTSIQDLLSGKSEDIASVVSAAAKADMSFKLLVGVRNKLIEAYKQTMSMPL